MTSIILLFAFCILIYPCDFLTFAFCLLPFHLSLGSLQAPQGQAAEDFVAAAVGDFGELGGDADGLVTEGAAGPACFDEAEHRRAQTSATVGADQVADLAYAAMEKARVKTRNLLPRYVTHSTFSRGMKRYWRFCSS